MRWLYDVDMEVFRAIHQDLHRDWLDPVFWLLSYSGLGQVQAALILSLYFWRSCRSLVLPLLYTLLMAGIPVAQGIKHLVERERPSLLAISKPQEEFLYNSYPSGHTTTSFGIAFMLWLLTRKGEYAWVGQLGLLWAVLVGVSRIYRGIHWPTDAIAGMFGGLASAAFVYLILGALGKLPRVDEPEPK